MNERQKVNLLGPVRRWMLAVALVAGVVLLNSAPSGAQSAPEKNTSSKGRVAAPPAEKASPAKVAQSHADGKTEGIKVHGHWTIEVRNPDGTVVTHREFENSLVPGSGPQFLASVLGRQGTVGIWFLFLRNNTNSALQPCTLSGQPQVCEIFEAGNVVSGTNSFGTLTVSVGTGGSLVLSGTMVASASGSIDSVQSSVDTCGPTVTPPTCNFPSGATITNGYSFTAAAVSPAVNVSFGQTVAVTVTFTFA